MFGIKRFGFTLIELLVAIAIVALLATVLIPSFWRSQPSYERKTFIARLNALMLYGKQNAITNYATHQVLFNFGERKISLLYDAKEKDAKGEAVFKPIPGGYLSSAITIPDEFDIKQLFIDNSGFDEMAKFSGRKTGEVWFYMVPEGLSQEVILNMYDTKDTLPDGKPRPVGLVLNPFTAQFKEYDTFQK